MKGIAEALSGCSQCGICQVVCPVYNLTGIESDGPRGKIAVLRAVGRGDLSAREASTPLRRCLLCGACSRACPADVPVARAFELARGQIRPAKREGREVVFDFLAGRPRLWNRIQNALYQLWRVRDYCPPPLNRLGDSLPAPRERFSAPIPRKAEGSKTVLLWPGCLATRGLPGVFESCADVLASVGFIPVVPDNLPCCGRSALIAGNEEKTRRLAIDALNALSAHKFDYLATPCPRCLSTIRGVWPRLVAGDNSLKEMAEAVASRALDINALALRDDIRSDANNLEWMSGDSAPKRESGERAESVSRETREAHCGACLPSIEKSLRRALARDCRDRLRASGEKFFESSCPARIVTIRRVMREYNDPTTIRHSIEALAERIKRTATEERTPADDKKSPDAKARGDREIG